MMKTRTLISLALALLLLTAAAAAADLKGTVVNRTTGKPAAGADIVLMKLEGGMDEIGRTKADAQGRFTLQLDNPGAPHLVRAIYKDVTYHRQTMPGATDVELEVFDSAAKVPGVNVSMNIVRLEPHEKELHVTELYAVKNQSNPPRTVMADRTFSIRVPAEAKIESAMVASGGGLPLTASPIPGTNPGEYGFMFPLRPGETRFQVAYSLPYTGSIDWKPYIGGTLEHLVVMVPASVELAPADPALYQPLPDEDGGKVRVATNVQPGQNVAFKISGTGSFPQQAQQGGTPGGEPAPGAEKPGGGIGTPIGTPNPIEQYMWWILGGFVVVMAAGAWFFFRQPAVASDDEDEAAAILKPTRIPPPAARRAAAAPAGAAPARTSGNGRQALLLEALKEELFTLETERAAGKISADDYRRAKDALDLTLQRALSRQK